MSLITPKKAIKQISRHFSTYKKMAPWPFCLRISVESSIVSFVAALFLILSAYSLGFLDMNQGEEFLLDGTAGDYYIGLFFSMVLFAPIIETLFLQSLPVFFMRLLSLPEKWQIILTTLVFALPHFLLLGIIPGLAAGLVGGAYHAFTYIHWRKKSWWTAFWVTSVSHGINNLIAFLGILITSYWV